MKRRPFQCVWCGRMVPGGANLCPYCYRDVYDKNAWYYRYAPNIVGAFLGALAWPLGLWTFAGLCGVGYPPDFLTIVATVAGGVVGFFRWDITRDAIDGFGGAQREETPSPW